MTSLGKNLFDDPSSVAGNLIPRDESYTLGTVDRPWANIYATAQSTVGNESITGNLAVSGTLSVGGTSTLHAVNMTGALAVTGAASVSGTSTLAAVAMTGNLGITSGDVSLNTLGKGINIKAGSDGKAGTVTLNGVTPVAVATTAFGAGSTVIFALKTVGGTVGAYPSIKTVTPATGFTVAGTASDTSVYNWVIIDSF